MVSEKKKNTFLTPIVILGILLLCVILFTTKLGLILLWRISDSFVQKDYWVGEGDVTLPIPDEYREKVGDSPFYYRILVHRTADGEASVCACFSRKREAFPEKPGRSCYSVGRAQGPGLGDDAIIIGYISLPWDEFSSDWGQAVSTQAQWQLTVEGDKLVFEVAGLSDYISMTLNLEFWKEILTWYYFEPYKDKVAMYEEGYDEKSPWRMDRPWRPQLFHVKEQMNHYQRETYEVAKDRLEKFHRAERGSSRISHYVRSKDDVNDINEVRLEAIAGYREHLKYETNSFSKKRLYKEAFEYDIMPNQLLSEISISDQQLLDKFTKNIQSGQQTYLEVKNELAPITILPDTEYKAEILAKAFLNSLENETTESRLIANALDGIPSVNAVCILADSLDMFYEKNTQQQISIVKLLGESLVEESIDPLLGIVSDSRIDVDVKHHAYVALVRWIDRREDVRSVIINALLQKDAYPLRGLVSSLSRTEGGWQGIDRIIRDASVYAVRREAINTLIIGAWTLDKERSTIVNEILADPNVSENIKKVMRSRMSGGRKR